MIRTNWQLNQAGGIVGAVTGSDGHTRICYLWQTKFEWVLSIPWEKRAKDYVLPYQGDDLAEAREAADKILEELDGVLF